MSDARFLWVCPISKSIAFKQPFVQKRQLFIPGLCGDVCASSSWLIWIFIDDLIEAHSSLFRVKEIVGSQTIAIMALIARVNGAIPLTIELR